MTSASEEFARQGQGTANRGRTILFIGLALGAVAAVLVALVLSGDDETPAVQPSVPSTRLAVSAVGDIPARTRLTRDMLEVQTYNTTDIDPEAFTAVSQVLNRVTARDITGGEVIVPSAVSSTTGQGLPFSLGEGMRAISITVSEVVITGGNISPDDRVDIIGYIGVSVGADVPGIVEAFTGERPAENLTVTEEGTTLAFTLLQNVRILAVAQNLTDEANRPSGNTTEVGAIAEREVEPDTEADRPNPGAATITLEVTPEQAQIMATANIRATLRLALRPFGDDEEVDVQPFLLTLN
jgi:pilus assembly protein CpaB